MRSYLVISLLVCAACQGEVITATTTPEPTTTPSAVSSTTSTFPTPSTTVATTTTSRPTTTSTAQTTTAPSVANGCEAQSSTEVPADATEPVAITGDVDGDGQEDTVTGYLWQGGSYLRLGLASGWGTSIRVDDQSDPNATLPLSKPGGVVSMSGDRLILNQRGGILVGAMYAFFAFRDCELHPVELAGGGLPEIWTGGGANHADWFTCEPERVVMRQFFLDDPMADPQVYVEGQATGFQYEPPSFRELGAVDMGIGFPVTRPDALVGLPPCAP